MICIQEVLSIALIYIYRIRRIKETYQRDLQKRKRGLYKGKETLLKRLVKATSVYRRHEVLLTHIRTKETYKSEKEAYIREKRPY